MSLKRAEPADLAALYDEDFCEWTHRSARLLREGRLDEADMEHVAEEIEDMGKRDWKELNSRIQVLIAHLLKWRFEPGKRSSSWNSTIVTQRIEIEADLEQSPSLRRRIPAGLPENYAKAVRRAAAETDLDTRDFPAECPFTVEQILDPEFLP